MSDTSIVCCNMFVIIVTQVHRSRRWSYSAPYVKRNG